jgi:hypothetical protein
MATAHANELGDRGKAVNGLEQWSRGSGDRSRERETASGVLHSLLTCSPVPLLSCSISACGKKSRFALLQSRDQAADHFGDGFEVGPKGGVTRVVEQAATAGDFEQGNALLDRAARDREEVFAVGRGEAAVALGEIGGDRESGAVELVGEEVEAAREGLSQGGDVVGEGDGALVDVELLEHEGHGGGSLEETYEDRTSGLGE